MKLHRLTANKETFRPVEFTEGLNVVLAEKATSSGKKDTRNGVGKTTLVDILLFCLGGQATKGKGIVQEALRSWVFTLEMTLKGSRVQVSRSVADPQHIRVKGNVDGWAIRPDHTELTGDSVYETPRWLTLLGWALFDLDPSVNAQNDHPVPKGLLSCFVRNGQPAYRNIDSHDLTGADGKEKVNLAYLLRLDWEFIGKIKELREALKDLRTTKKGIQDKSLFEVAGNPEEIRVEQSKIQAEIAELKKDLASRDFSSQYEHLQDRINELTRDTLSLTSRITAEKRKLGSFLLAIQAEQDATPEVVEELYREAGFAFPELLRKTLAEVQAFHEQVVVNRKGFLGSEISRLSDEIKKLTQERDEKSKRKGELTSQLETQDVYTELAKHQERLAELKSLDNRHEQWLKDIEGLDQKIKDREAEIDKTRKDAADDFGERKSVLDKFFEDFSLFTSELYGKPGVLSILPEKDDYAFSVDMAKRGSDGVRQMGIFCFDLALLKAQGRFGREASFLIHDTPLFDAVDDRQRALALEIADRETRAMHGQYVCTMNSDKIPRDEFSKDFDFDSHVIHKLSDATPSDSLLGIHFEADS